MIRVLVVDDSQVARDLLVEVLGSDAGIEIVGTARDGRQAVELVAELKPDVVTMDVQMPVMDGYAATREIMTTHPTPIVVVSGSGSEPDVRKSLQSLEAGALSVIGKPPSPQSPGFESAAVQLQSLVKSMAAVKVVRMRRPRPEPDCAPDEPVPEALSGNRPKLIAITASTGGPQALHRILACLPEDFPIPIAIVQHISASFTEGLVEWLNGIVPIDVRVARPGEAIRPRSAVVAAEDQHLGIATDGTFETVDRPPVGGFRPSGTVLFEAAARALGPAVVAVVLTGMGRDGCEGLRSVRQRGGRSIVQSPETCAVDGMPGAAIAAGLADAVVPLDEIGPLLVQLATEPSRRSTS